TWSAGESKRNHESAGQAHPEAGNRAFRARATRVSQISQPLWARGIGLAGMPRPNWARGIGLAGMPRPNWARGIGLGEVPRPNWGRGIGFRPPILKQAAERRSAGLQTCASAQFWRTTLRPGKTLRKVSPPSGM